MRKSLIALISICLALASACYQNQLPPLPPYIFDDDDSSITNITSLSQMKSMLSDYSDGTYYLDNVPVDIDQLSEAVEVNGNKRVLGSVDILGDSSVSAFSSLLAEETDAAVSTDAVAVFRIGDNASVEFSDFSVTVEASVDIAVQVFSVDKGAFSADGVSLNVSSLMTVTGLAIGSNATASNISIVNSATVSIVIDDGNEEALEIIESIKQENPDSENMPSIATQYDVASAEEFAEKLAELNRVRLVADSIELSGISLEAGTAYVIDLNENSLSVSANGTIIIPESSDVTFQKGTFSTIFNGAESNYANIGINDSAILRFLDVDYTGNAAGIGPNADSTFIAAEGSSITTEGAYAIATNASTDASGELLYGNVTISITDSIVEAVDGMAICFNVPGNLTIAGSEVSGVWQAVLVRGGNAEISGSTITATCDYAKPAYESQNWGSGNCVPFGALVVGNRSSSYKYPTVCNVDDATTISMTGTGTYIYDVYIASSNGLECSVTVNLPEEYAQRIIDIDKSYWLLNPDTDVLILNGDSIESNPS